MLTASQCRVVAFMSDGGILCRDCAEKAHGIGIVTSLEEGLDAFGLDVSPLIEYELSSYYGEILWERAEEDVDYKLAGRFPELRDALVDREFTRHGDEDYPCDSCGRECS